MRCRAYEMSQWSPARRDNIGGNQARVLAGSSPSDCMTFIHNSSAVSTREKEQKPFQAGKGRFPNTRRLVSFPDEGTMLTMKQKYIIGEMKSMNLEC